MIQFNNITVWVRGAGELASATALILHRLGFHVFLTELPTPLAIRRTVTFSDAILKGETMVEGTKAIKINTYSLPKTWQNDYIPIFEDSLNEILTFQPQILVDARMLKSANESIIGFAPFTVGLGPGFDAGRTCHTVIETMRGHNLGKIIRNGSALPNTKIPGVIGGETVRRVLYASADGYIEWGVDFGDIVAEYDVIGIIDQKHKIRASLNGMIRGLISPEIPIKKGLKIADIDPRRRQVDNMSTSDKSRSVARGVLEAILIFLKETDAG